MRYLASRIKWVIALSVLIVGSCSAQTDLRVNEASARIHIRADGTEVDLPIKNESHQTTAAHILLELVDPRGIVQVQGNQEAILASGSTKIKLVLPPVFENEHNLLWYRLRYTITPRSSGRSNLTPVMGILSVGQGTPRIFELHVAGPSFVREQGHYAARVRAIHPVTGQPVAGVAVQASLDLDTDDNKPLLTQNCSYRSWGICHARVCTPRSGRH